MWNFMLLRYEVFKAVTMGSAVLLDVMLVDIYQFFLKKPVVFIFTVGDVKCKNVRYVVLWW